MVKLNRIEMDRTQPQVLLASVLEDDEVRPCPPGEREFCIDKLLV